MRNFIYVYSLDAKQKLLAAGFKLIKEDIRNSLFVFDARSQPQDALNFSRLDISYILSDTLTF